MRLERCFKEKRPDIVLCHGDTTTCFAAAVSSFYHQIPFFHVEAGLRTHRLNSPFPEEFNRQTVAPIATHHFAPTDLERNNLIRDGVSSSSITVTGTTVHDAIDSILSKHGKSVSTVDSDGRPVVTVTLHRRESNESIRQTLEGIRAAAHDEPQALFVCPVHPNPIVKNVFHRTLKGMENVLLTGPMDYPSFISLLLKTQVVVTDSGGVQEEAAFLGKRVLLARSETERMDGVESGLVKFVGHASNDIRQNIIDELVKSRDGLSPRMKSIRSASDIISDHVERALR